MTLEINKAFFSRNRHREQEYGSFFSKASSSLYLLINVIIAGVFAPAVVATSLASKDVILMLANISLCVGYATNFAYRVILREISTSELIISLLGVAAAVCATFYLLPAITSWTLINTLCFANYMATAVNGFFMIRNLIVPPCKKLVEHIAEKFGYKIGGRFFYRKPLTLELDRYAIDNLFMKHYGYDSQRSLELGQFDDDLAPFNKMLQLLCRYIDKYNEALLGSVSNADDISAKEKLIVELTEAGSSANSLAFIQKKIRFKTTKITQLEQAKTEVNSIEASDSLKTVRHKLRFFDTPPPISNAHTKMTESANHCLDTEQQRQMDKINGNDDQDIIGLRECIPRAA